VIEDQLNILPMIRQLKNLGISIALDDFGTGYSSLSYLTMFPFDKIKIDKSFTQNMTRRSECAAIVSSVLTLGRCLGIATTAEGVETEQQFASLLASGVDMVQGYLFGRPCPVSELDFGKVQLRPSAADAA
jgi:EAL domain-containing protein (putative c-di-GMP-specific phosphodiesterase class I)